MPDKDTIRKAREDKRAGKSASTQAGEFVHREIDQIRKVDPKQRDSYQVKVVQLYEHLKTYLRLSSAPEVAELYDLVTHPSEAQATASDRSSASTSVI